MMNCIHQYYQAIMKQDLPLLNQVLHKQIYGVRTYKGDIYFTNKEVLQYAKENPIDSYHIDQVDSYEDTYHLRIKINQQDVLVKIVVKEKKIYKIYEVLSTNKRRIKCIISYDGSSYSGYQKQQNASSIQSDIEKALEQIFHEEIIIHSSGRTDKGVHAVHQVIHFDVDTTIQTKNMKRLFNSYLPDAIYVKQVEEVPQTFHSRYDVKVKTYQYIINLGEFDPIKRNMEWTVDSLLLDQFEKDLKTIIGEHDFASFTKSTDHITVRTIYNASMTITNNHLYLTIEGNGFLRYMVRNIVGALVAINKGKLPYTIQDLLTMKDVNIIKDIAPAKGLYLYHVQY